MGIPTHKKTDLLQRLRVHPQVAIYGAGYIGELLLASCRKHGLAAACFVDDDPSLSSQNGLEVLSIPEAAKRFPEAGYLISMRIYYPHAYKLQAQGVKHIYGGGILFEDEDLCQYQDSARSAQSFARILYTHEVHKHVPCPDPTRLVPDCMIHVITDRCTLRCACCNQYLPHLKSKRGDVPAELILQDMKRLLQYIDYLPLYDFMGGETLLHNQLPEILEATLQEEQIARIQLATNGTILPSPQLSSVLANDRISLLISDYGEVSTRLAKLTEHCDRVGIHYFVAHWKEWSVCSYPKKYNRSPAAHQRNFDNCSSRFRTNYHNGKLYRCGTQIYVYDLVDEVPDFPNDYLDIRAMEECGQNPREIKEAIRSYLASSRPLDFCDYCDFGEYSSTSVGQQIDKKDTIVD